MNALFKVVLLVSFGFSILLSSCRGQIIPKLQIIPAPKEVTFKNRVFILDQTVPVIPVARDLRASAELLNEFIEGMANYKLPDRRVKKSRNSIYLLLDTTMRQGPEGYQLSIREDGIQIKAATSAGVFYGVQTLVQLLSDVQFFNREKRCWHLPAMEICDEPVFVYRGLHLDVSRHFFPKAFVMKCIDLMATYKINTLHWHLTDAAGWRIEIKKYPELTNVAAWRWEANYLDWWKGDRRYAKKGAAGAYGGYYTQKEIREIVAYAKSKYVTVIPEIEMPGHSEEVLAVYPYLSCSGKPYKNGEFCIGNEKTFQFVEDVLTEVLDLFPSEYIHIGGDEASKAAWKKCPKCRKRMKTEKLKDEKELQSYMIKRVGEFLKSKGRKLLGWDEILEGGLAPEATVMSWRGEAGGIEAAKSGHYVVMTPGAFCYFDSYQADPQTQPLAISGFTPYLKTYSYNPVPEVLSAEEAKYILGAQGNVWTEYISTTEHVEYMIFPRLLALSEVVWSPKELRDREDFKYRVGKHIGLLKNRGVNVFTLSDRIDILTEVDTPQRRFKVTFDSERYRPEIRYTIDGSEPNRRSALYKEPFYITDSAVVKAAIFTDGVRSETCSAARLDYHKAIGKKVTYVNSYSGSYPAAGHATLTDGYRGGLTYSDGRWQGFLKHIDVTIDLGSVTALNYVSAKFMQLTGPGVYMPDYVKVSVSEDGVNFKEVAVLKNDIPTDKPELFFKDFTARFKEKGRYVRLFAKKHSGFQFIDEIVVY